MRSNFTSILVAAFLTISASVQSVQADEQPLEAIAFQNEGTTDLDTLYGVSSLDGVWSPADVSPREGFAPKSPIRGIAPMGRRRRKAPWASWSVADPLSRGVPPQGWQMPGSGKSGPAKPERDREGSRVRGGEGHQTRWGCQRRNPAPQSFFAPQPPIARAFRRGSPAS